MPRITHVRTGLVGATSNTPDAILRNRMSAKWHARLRIYVPCPISLAALKYLSNGQR